MQLVSITSQEGLAKANAVSNGLGYSIVVTGFSISAIGNGTTGVVATRTYANRNATWYTAAISKHSPSNSAIMTVQCTIPQGAATVVTKVAEIYLEGTLGGVPFLIATAAPDAPLTYDPAGSLTLELSTQLLSAIASSVTYNISSAVEIGIHETNSSMHPLNNLGGNRAPTVNDDVIAGYSPKSQWVWGTRIWYCTSNAARAAVWRELVPTSQRNTANGYAGLTNGLLTLSQVPVLPKTRVGLGNVNNTSDVNKPVSTATQNALNLKVPLSQRNVALGYEGLDANGRPMNSLVAPNGRASNLGASTTVTGFDLNYIAYALPSGLYDGINMTNTPQNDKGWWYVQNYRHSSNGINNVWAYQVATAFGTGHTVVGLTGGDTYERHAVMVGTTVTWSAWRKAGVPIATAAQALGGTDNATIMTPLRVKSYVDTYVTPLLPAPTGDVLYDIPGTYYWTTPAKVTYIELSVSGGAGAGSNIASGGIPGSTVNRFPTTGGTTYTIVVGAGGNSWNIYKDSAGGTPSSVSSPTKTLITAQGGDGALGPPTGAGWQISPRGVTVDPSALTPIALTLHTSVPGGIMTKGGDGTVYLHYS